MGKDLAASTTTFFFCDGGSCQKAGSEIVTRTARAYIRNNNLWNKTHTIKTRCNGRCEDAPTCIVQNGNYWYKDLTASKIQEIIASHVNEQKGVTPYLLYQNNWDKVVSEKDIKPIQPKGFEHKNDVDLGMCCITKGFSSDQYLFPLFLFLLQTKSGASLQLNNGELFDFKNLVAVRYEDAYAITLEFLNEKMVHLIIGLVPKTEPIELVQQKIMSTEYFRLTSNGDKGIRFKNKIGKTVAIIKLDSINNTIWDYCLDIQLGGILAPHINETNV
ncbi:MAG: (2Fe-2S) ferredoxin domain-containing protein [Lutibacter sp.]|nr:(2Fe-2S) ferredoxin domain-containing protein [Lutibacter sp.]MBP9602021.1 (2Fe-2S) ferredoxin domain-containing protein [Lutibacter sp.]